MKVFISWSGEFSRAVAEALRQYLPCMIHDLEVFMSQHDLRSGVRWGIELAKELEASSFGILCLAPDNLKSEWLMYEAGALTKHADGRACSVLLGNLRLANVPIPLAQFQNRAFDKDGAKALISDLNVSLPRPLPSHSLDLVFEKWWPDIEAIYKKASAAYSTQKHDDDPAFPKELHHVSLVVSNLEACKDFYGTKLGLPPSARQRPENLGFDGAWYQLPNGQELHLVEKPKEEDKELEYRNNHFALRVSDIDKAEADLKSKGVVPKRFPALLTGFPQLYIQDPDGHVVEINMIAEREENASRD